MKELQEATTLEKFLIEKAAAKGIPITTKFVLTPTCNLDCSMCYIHISPKRLEELGGWQSLEDWEKTAQELKQLGTLFILLTGGEPLLYPDFTELYTYLAKEGFILTINTNGTLITPQIAQLWKKQLPRRVNVTLYGASEDTYEKLCGNRNGFKQCLNGLELMKEYHIPVKINMSLVKENLHEYPDMMHIAEDMGFPVVADSYMLCDCFSFCQPKRDINSHRITPEQSGEYALKQIMYEKGNIYPEVARHILKEIESEQQIIHEPQGLSCYGGVSSCWIDFRGNMLPCDLMEDYAYSLKEYTTKEAWTKIRTAREQVEKYNDCIDCKLKAICSVCWANARMEKRRNGSLNYLCKSAKEKLRQIELSIK